MPIIYEPRRYDPDEPTMGPLEPRIALDLSQEQERPEPVARPWRRVLVEAQVVPSAACTSPSSSAGQASPLTRP